MNIADDHKPFSHWDPPLTSRLSRIVRLRQQRLTYKEIAVRVGVHPATVSKHANEMQALPFATRCDTSRYRLAVTFKTAVTAIPAVTIDAD